MPITIRDDAVFVLLNTIDSLQAGTLDLSAQEIKQLNLSSTDLLGHLDYLNQEGYINARFSGDAYADQGPNPLPKAVALQSAELTQKGQEMLAEMKTFPPKAMQVRKVLDFVQGAIPEQDRSFLQKVQAQAGFPDLYDARDFTVTVFRTMRDLMTTEQSDQVAEELHKEAFPTDKRNPKQEISELWKDTNPLVAFLSRLRAPMNREGWLGIDDERFMRRIGEEGGLPRGVTVENALEAVFAATKDELPPERIAEISQVLPSGVKRLWDQARPQ